ncbi:hypothetical protein ACX27_27455 [Nostoc piscinale CENA21]|uniref:Uncharacterized protein n=1 Tax=Nostoc piscinale CENA21 TaxID=224013 RepID=A0A0M4T5X0_9NOSO|nr:hypothetical protein [Nostoc piscinale]ALF55745.1 hypothetical protein ACX27_27455 [Nostoc piscinale CENA21]
MSLDQLITSAYNKYQAEIKAQKEAKEAEEHRWVDNAIAEFKAFLDKAIPPEIQLELGIEIKAVYNQSAWAEFTFCSELLTICRYGSERLNLNKGGHTLGGKYIDSGYFLNVLLTELGKIRAEFPTINLEEVESIQIKLESHYIGVKAIASSSDTWKQLCDRSPEIKKYLEDALCNLEMAIGYLEEVIKE